MNDNQDSSQPLLKGDNVKKRGILKCVLKTLIWIIFLFWIVFIFLQPLGSVETLFKEWYTYADTTILGEEAPYLYVYSAPLVILALLSLLFLAISEADDQNIKTEKGGNNNNARWRLWTFPVVVGGPLGIVSAAELLGIIAFIIYIIYALSTQIILAFISYNLSTDMLIYMIGVFCARIATFSMVFLFLPVARGSPLLQLINIPYEHALKYHKWLGTLTMSFITIHVLLIISYWILEGDSLLTQISTWQIDGTSYIAGLVAISCGLLMWVFALTPIRRRNFELFYYTHHLYIILIIFIAIHMGWRYFSIVVGAIFLFMLDRFLRLWQSRTVVKVISATSFPSGVVKLVLSKPKNLRYNALSCIFLRIREASLIQWHPFSVASSPMDGENSISIFIKGRGEWTTKVLQNSTELTASVEGPYGPQIPCYLEYENLILVAGGIGITPFLAILSDVLHRIKLDKPCQVKRVLLVWSVKESVETIILSTLDINSICPDFSNMLNLKIIIHVTQETEPPTQLLEEGGFLDDIKLVCRMSSTKSVGTMSTMVGPGQHQWVGLYVFASTIGFFIIHTLLCKFYFLPYSIESKWYKGTLLLACVAAGLFIFGGSMLYFWYCCGRDTADEVLETEPKVQSKGLQTLGSMCKTFYGSRPDLKEIFEDVGQRWGGVDVGVIVCAPEGLTLSAAKECRSFNLRRNQHQPIFHFNNLSFDI